MTIETKYSLGDRVFMIRNARKDVRTSCTGCSGTGWITLDDKQRKRCPVHACRHGDIYTLEDAEWAIAESSTVGEVRYSAKDAETEERYMLHATGIGSGTVWHVDDLWPTGEAALAECGRRNKEASDGG